MKNRTEFLGRQIDKSGVKMQQHIVQKIINSKEELDTKKITIIFRISKPSKRIYTKISRKPKTITEKLKKDVEYNYNEEDKK